MQKKPRGLALVTVLMATGLLAMLSASLVVLTRSNFVSGEQFRRRQVLLNTCYSGLDYARARLSQRMDWGIGPMSASLNAPQLTATESGSDVNSNLVEATMVATRGRFTVRMLNNLQGLGEQNPPVWCRSRVKIPPRCALVAVDGDYEGVRRRIEVLLTRRSVLSNSIVAGKDLAIMVPPTTTSNALEFKSIVPRGNSARAKGQIYLPKTNQLQFVPQGQAQSAGEISIDSQLSFDASGNLVGASGTGLSSNPAALASASTALSATLQTNSNVGNAKFKPDKLAVPGGATATLAPGEYRFTQPDSVLHFDTSGNPVAAYINGQLAGVTLKDYQFMPRGNVTVNGDLTISGNITAMRYVPPPATNPTGFGTITGGQPQPFRASLGLGYDADGLPVGANARNRFTVNGDLEVHGDLVGSGQLFVKSSGTSGGNIKVEGNSFLSATRTDGMAVVSDRHTVFSEVPGGSYQAPFAMVKSDFDAFGLAIMTTRPTDTNSINVFNNFTAASKPALQAMATNLLAQQLMDRTSYRQIVKDMLATTDSNWPPAGGATLGGAPMDNLPFDYVDSGGTHSTVTAMQGIANYLSDMGPGNVTLEEHLRIREFIKSVDQGTFKFEHISPFLPGTASQPVPYNTPAIYNSLQAIAVNQVGAYYQDARIKGQTLINYMSWPNPYDELARRDFTFGGILYSGQNIFTKLASSFRLVGSMISDQGTIGFDNVVNGTILFDPNACEDQFDWAMLGLGPIFFWTP
ncbi:hypothetical protein IV102_00720 [bacterium]|nr:hypothetical protein [bacterium]